MSTRPRIAARLKADSMAESFGGFVVDIAKLRDYCLSETHPRGRHKARVFRARLGLTEAHAIVLRDALLAAVPSRPAALIATEADEHGRRFVLDFEMATDAGAALIRSAWILPQGQDVLRLSTCYIL